MEESLIYATMKFMYFIYSVYAYLTGSPMRTLKGIDLMPQWILFFSLLLVFGVLLGIIPFFLTIVYLLSKPTRRMNILPQLPEQIFWFLPYEQRDVLLGDLDEEFYTLIKRISRKKAILWYYWQIVTTIWAFGLQRIMKLIEWSRSRLG